MARWLGLALLLTGCTTTIVVPNPYSSPEVERARLQCVAQGGLWQETAERFQCRPPHPDPAT